MRWPRSITLVFDYPRPVCNPGRLSYEVLRETEMGFEFNLVVTPRGDELSVSPDIVRGELRVTAIVGGAVKEFSQGVEKPTGVGDVTPREVGPFQTDEGTPIHVEFVWIDDATPENESKVPATLDFVLNDTVPPLDPGNILAVKDVKEV